MVFETMQQAGLVVGWVESSVKIYDFVFDPIDSEVNFSPVKHLENRDS